MKISFPAAPKIMSQHRIKNDGPKSLKPGRFIRSLVTEIPIDFTIDLPLCFPIKIQPEDFMNHAIISAQRPLIPALFQIAGRADDLKALPSFKSALALGHTPLSEMMLDPEKLEEILRTVAQKKKGARRVSEKRLSVSDADLV